jgi:hypothetical protein
VRVFRTIAASPHTVFRLLADPGNHAELDGSEMLGGDPDGPHQLRLGDTFTMGMSQVGRGCRSINQVVEFGRIVIGGQRWRYILHADPAGTLVEHGYVWGYARMPLLSIRPPGFPRRMRPAKERSLANLAVLAAQQQRPGRRLIADRENRL